MNSCENCKEPLGKVISYNTIVDPHGCHTHPYPPYPPCPPPYPPYPPCPPQDDHNKISHLPEIKNIDSEDLFLISDYENGRCFSKKLSVGHLMDYIADNVASSMISDIVPAIISSEQIS